MPELYNEQAERDGAYCDRCGTHHDPNHSCDEISIEALEAAWRTASAAEDRHADAGTIQAESDAWDAYAAACHEIDQCLSPGCRATDEEHAYCPAHRD